MLLGACVGLIASSFVFVIVMLFVVGPFDSS